MVMISPVLIARPWRTAAPLPRLILIERDQVGIFITQFLNNSPVWSDDPSFEIMISFSTH
jgi:hypothetical protein